MADIVQERTGRGPPEAGTRLTRACGGAHGSPAMTRAGRERPPEKQGKRNGCESERLHGLGRRPQRGRDRDDLAAEAGSFVTYAAQHLHGGIGLDNDYPLHRSYLWSRHLELTLGSAAIHLERIGDDLAESPAGA